MAIIKEWFCAEHGEFEASHPICPALGCDSSDVIQEHRTPPAIMSDTTKRTDAGLRKTADSYGLSNLRSAKEGESAKPNNQADGVLWGEQAQKFLGVPLTQAHVPVTYNVKNDKGEAQQWTDRGGMRTAANDIGITRSVLPPAERTFDAKDKQARERVTKR